MKKTIGYPILALILMWVMWSAPVLAEGAEDFPDVFYRGTEFGTKKSDYVPTFTRNGVRKPFNAFHAGEIPPEGWKLHVSATPQSAQQIAEVLPKLRQMNIYHKVVLSRDKLVLLEGSDTQAGKFITIYPKDVEEAKRIVKMLDEALAGRGLAGTVIKGEKAVGSSGLVYARYGEFKDGHEIINPNTGEPETGLRGNKYKPDWIDDPWDETETAVAKKPPVGTGPAGGQAARKHPRQDLARIKQPGKPRHRLPDYKPLPGETELVLEYYDDIVRKKVKPLQNLKNKQWLGIVDVTPDEIEAEILKKYNYDALIKKYPELLDVAAKRRPVLKKIVKEMIQEQVNQANRARYKMWRGLSGKDQQNVLKTRSFWDKNHGPQSQELINQLVTLEMLTDIAVTYYDEGPAAAAVQGGIGLAFLVGFKGLAAAVAAYAPESALATALQQFGTGVSGGLSYLWPVVLVNVAYNTVYVAGNWTLDVLRYDTVDKLYVDPSKHNRDYISYWTFLNTYYLGKKGIKGPASRDNLFAVFPEQNDLVTSIYAYKVWYNREAVYTQNLAMSPVYGYDAWLYMEQAALKDWETGYNAFMEKVAEALRQEFEEDQAKLAQFNTETSALINAGDLRDPQPRAMVTDIEFSPEKSKPGDTIKINTTYAVFGLPTIDVASKLALQVVGGAWKADEQGETQTIQFDKDNLVRILTKETSVKIPDSDQLGDTRELSVNGEITASPGPQQAVLAARIPLERGVLVPDLSVFEGVPQMRAVLSHAGLRGSFQAKTSTKKEEEFKFAGQDPVANTEVDPTDPAQKIVKVYFFQKYTGQLSETSTTPAVLTMQAPIPDDPKYFAGTWTVADGSATQEGYSGEYVYKGTYSWTSPPANVGPQGFSITMNATCQVGPKQGGIATGIGISVEGFDLVTSTTDRTPAKREATEAPVNCGTGQSNAGSVTVYVMPRANYYEGEVAKIKIGAFWGAGVTYRYAATQTAP
ncbi:MAG: hypothetical protein ACREVE_04735 [Gammaproteobacteria bacterium]